MIELAGYKRLLGDVRDLLERARGHAYKAVDNLRVQTYWQIGERIAREELKQQGRAIYSKKVIIKLARDLGFGRVILYRILQFYKAYPIVSTVPRQLSWSHLVELIMITNPEERRFYERLAAGNVWSSRELRTQIQNKLYSKKARLVIPQNDKALALRGPEEIFKNTYNFEFLRLSEAYSEGEMEEGLLRNAEQLLFELGLDFSLTGRQRKIMIDDHIHVVDLEFYHRGIPCVILVDLKIGRFKSEYVGQMNKYLNFYRENRKYLWEKDPIGLIICEDKGKEEAHYALGNLANRIFIAEYKVKLPSEKDIISRLRGLNK